MQIDKKTLRQWKLKTEWGEIEKIIAFTNINRQTISDAIKYGKCTDKTKKALDEYFDSKK